jgi:S-(hydroxymethyl)glutathione dehydrogenase/alcohol dehydrogenase
MGAMTDVDVKLNLLLFTMLQKTLKGNIFDEMVTNTYRLEDNNEGYQDMLAGKNIRGVICYTEADW